MYNDFIKLLSPFAPHISEELWEISGNKDSVFSSSWPKYDENKLIKNTMNIAIQVNGKLRGQINIETNLSKEDIMNNCKNHENASLHIKNKEIIKEIYVPGKLVNFVVKQRRDMNPFIEKTKQKYNSVPFEDIKSEHFLPAVKHYIRKTEENINQIISISNPCIFRRI